jgi:hypothetical protein
MRYPLLAASAGSCLALGCSYVRITELSVRQPSEVSIWSGSPGATPQLALPISDGEQRAPLDRANPERGMVSREKSGAVAFLGNVQQCARDDEVLVSAGGTMLDRATGGEPLLGDPLRHAARPWGHGWVFDTTACSRSRSGKHVDYRYALMVATDASNVVAIHETTTPLRTLGAVVVGFGVASALFGAGGELWSAKESAGARVAFAIPLGLGAALGVGGAFTLFDGGQRVRLDAR